LASPLLAARCRESAILTVGALERVAPVAAGWALCDHPGALGYTLPAPNIALWPAGLASPALPATPIATRSVMNEYSDRIAQWGRVGQTENCSLTLDANDKIG